MDCHSGMVLFYDGGDLFLSLPVESQRFQQYRFGGAENIA